MVTILRYSMDNPTLLTISLDLNTDSSLILPSLQSFKMAKASDDLVVSHAPHRSIAHDATPGHVDLMSLRNLYGDLQEIFVGMAFKTRKISISRL